MSRRRHRSSWKNPSPPARAVNRCRALLVIDNQPLQTAAWTALQRARKQLEKTAADLHRHEEIDEPAFRAWLSNTFATLLSTVRELAQQVHAKDYLIDAVLREAFLSGRSPAKIWHEWQQHGGRPPEPPADHPRTTGSQSAGGSTTEQDEAFDEEMKRFFGQEDNDDDDSFGGAFPDFADDSLNFGDGRPKAREEKATNARTIYRRMVQHLHPDRGGAWTPARAHAWEQTQAAWAARDADWLSRLEAEWEAGTDLLGPTSVLGRLRAAIVALDAARRDTEKRLRLYREQDSWRFSLRPPSSALKQRVERQLRHDEFMLRQDLKAMEATLAQWGRTHSRRRRKPSRSNPF